MKTWLTCSLGWRRRRMGPAAGLMLLVAAGFTLRAVDEKFETLRVGTMVFTNAVVVNTTESDVFIQHDGGLSNVKAKDIEPKILRELGYDVPDPDKAGFRFNPIPERLRTNVAQRLEADPKYQAIEKEFKSRMGPGLPPLPKGLIAGALAVAVLGHLFMSYCCSLIVRKTGNQPGLLVWIPVLQLLPLTRAAGMPGWWLIVWLLPLVNLVAMVLWSFKIVETRGKGVVWAVMLLLPGLNLLAFLYLAFSSGEAPPGATAPQNQRRAA